jgi:hypothetical protein
MTEQKSWWGRNWPWAGPLGCVGCGGCAGLLVFLFVGGGLASLFGVLSASFASAEPVQQALESARRNPAIVEALGEPIEIGGGLPNGSLQTSPTDGSADLSVPLEGPNGKGRLYVVAEKDAGEWTTSRAEVELDGRPGRIDLMAPEPEL